ncbi:MAG TPA: methyltransferase domain-containing protein [Gemmatimonadaceae bacterium]|nr:methyltransferase domain-containing protein [Gemmatimonadaceae bacterium]
MILKTHFDTAYYRRYYEDRETAVVDADMKRNEVKFVIAFCNHIGLKVKRFTDVGAGTGWWAEEFGRTYRSCEVIETFDASEAACDVYGHKRVLVQNLTGPASDLVVCRDVLRYVPDKYIDRAIRRLERKCRGVLYLHAITSDDDIDTDASDMAGIFRTAAFYRRLLKAAGFRDCGMGLFVSARLKSFVPFAIEAR